MTSSRGAHVAEKRKPSLIHRIVTTAGIFGTAITIALAATAGSYALWNDKTKVNVPSITAGSTGLTINGLTDAPVTMTPGDLYPGRSVVSTVPLTVKNTGTTSLSITATAPIFTNPTSELARNLVVALRPSATCAPGLPGTAPAALPASMGPAPLVLAPGAQSQLCLEVYLNTAAPASVKGATAAFAVQLNGAQVPRA